MANGQVVLVTTEGLSGDPPTRTVYYVAEEDPTTAQAIIAKIMAPNEKVEAYGLLPEAAVKAPGIKGRRLHLRKLSPTDTTESLTADGDASGGSPWIA